MSCVQCCFTATGPQIFSVPRFINGFSSDILHTLFTCSTRKWIPCKRDALVFTFDKIHIVKFFYKGKLQHHQTLSFIAMLHEPPTSKFMKISVLNKLTTAESKVDSYCADRVRCMIGDHPICPWPVVFLEVVSNRLAQVASMGHSSHQIPGHPCNSSSRVGAQVNWEEWDHTITR